MELPLRIGLLPLYLALYDERLPQMRERLEGFLRGIAEGFTRMGAEVKIARVCRVEPEFAKALRDLEEEGVDVLVTLHLAYSPSLESADMLAGSDLPIVMLDTTPDHAFGPDADPDLILYNHGIHGLQDLASMLRRLEKPYRVVAGHFSESDVMERALEVSRGARAATLFRKSRVLRIGESFRGMGDFAVAESVLLEQLGIGVTQETSEGLLPCVSTVTGEEIEAEMALDRERFRCDLNPEVHQRSVRLGLGLRRRIEEGGFDAVSMNFLAFDTREGLVNTVPFLEVSKAMARGIGYAGEGDVLTAALVGALSRSFGKTTFTEIFCPDWKGGSLFLSHMGEINPETAAEKPVLLEKPYEFTDALNPAMIACAPRPGPAVLVNLAPGPGDSFSLLIAPVEVLGDAQHPEMKKWVRGWIRPNVPLPEFLERYSHLGGTHHSALILDGSVSALQAFGLYAGIETHTIG